MTERKSGFRRVVCSIAQKFHSHEHPGEEKAGWNKNVAGPILVDSTSLRGKVALITGSSKSIGASIAKTLAAQGAFVVINYAKDGRSAEEVAQQINMAAISSTSDLASGSLPLKSMDHHGNGDNDVETPRQQPEQQQAIVIKADSSTISGGQYLLQETLRLFGRLDILVLSAGLMGSKALSEIDESFFDAHFNFNVKAPLFLVKAAADVMTRPGGRIIFLSTSLTAASSRSTLSVTNTSSKRSCSVPALLPNALCYVASKGAVEQITRALAKDLGTQGFTVNTIAPGPVNTALFRAGTPQHVIDSIAAQIPNHRIAEPDDIAPIVAFLASPAAQWVNGQILGVNGGYVV
ncbi:hypothetical protein DFJ43DRAFT_1079278 [Lentinula guzmanii]|uniref:NAD(P)-binding protein n=1 Tax=Lentinula guzmanii TaxID=2804957 RepID=A0AA38JQC2_9AGAR|nr:hypothetical protein DFJ43DRAFT_1079278 [Lentinula guzmanii]